MRLALLGSDHELQTLLRDLPAEHTIVAAFDAAEPLLPLGALLPQVERGENWESLLVRDDVDLVIVASPRNLLPTADGMDPQARRVDQLKKLAQAGVNLLVSHPAADLLDAYEIEMLRREGGGLIAVWIPGAAHPAWNELTPQMCRVLNDEAYVPVDYYDQVDWERSVAVQSKQEVLAALARDLLMMERLAGKAKRVTALAAGGLGGEGNPQSWKSLSVQVECTNGPHVRWSVMRGGDDLAARLQFTGPAGQWQLLIPAERTRVWEMVPPISPQQIADWNDWDEARATLLAVEQMRRSPQHNSEAWLTACRSLEALAAVEKSLQRGRTIEVAQSEQSEEHNFKGVMASAGCLLLFLILFAVFVVALVEGLRLPLRDSALWRLWPLALIVPLAIFLGLQFLQTVIQKPQSR